MTSSFSPCHVRFGLHGCAGIFVKKTCIIERFSGICWSCSSCPPSWSSSHSFSQAVSLSLGLPSLQSPGFPPQPWGLHPPASSSAPAGPAGAQPPLTAVAPSLCRSPGVPQWRSPSEKRLSCPSSTYLGVNGRSWLFPCTLQSSPWENNSVNFTQGKVNGQSKAFGTGSAQHLFPPNELSKPALQGCAKLLKHLLGQVSSASCWGC